MRRSLVALVSLVMIGAAACGDDGGGEDDSGGGNGGGDDVSEQRDELRAGGDDEATDGDVEPVSYDEAIELSVEDVQAFWAEQLPEFYGQEYEPIPDENIRTYGPDQDLTEVSECFATSGVSDYEDVGPNAFYCSLDNTVVYDDFGLFPDLFDEFGGIGVAAVIAHEWGHAIQGQTSGLDAAESIVIETQADCAAGAWVARVEAGDSELLGLDEGELEVAMAAVLSFRDPPGSDPENPLAHGSGFDRVTAFQAGFIDGIARCSTWQDEPPTFTELPFETIEEEESGGNLDLDELLPLVTDDLNAYWSDAAEEFEEIDEPVAYDVDDDDSLPECDSIDFEGDDFRGKTFWCSDDNTVYYDENLFDVVHDQFGDFGVAVLLSNAYATAVLEQAEFEGDVLTVDCLSGSWAGSIPPLGTRSAEIEISPGDLDEAIQSFVAFGQLAEETGEEAASAFDRTAAFSAGFFAELEEGAGIDVCTSVE